VKYLEISEDDLGFMLSFDPWSAENFDVGELTDFIDSVQEILDEAPEYERKELK
jgi:hypothetical protein